MPTCQNLSPSRCQELAAQHACIQFLFHRSSFPQLLLVSLTVVINEVDCFRSATTISTVQPNLVWPVPISFRFFIPPVTPEENFWAFLLVGFPSCYQAKVSKYSRICSEVGLLKHNHDKQDAVGYGRLAPGAATWPKSV